MYDWVFKVKVGKEEGGFVGPELLEYSPCLGLGSSFSVMKISGRGLFWMQLFGIVIRCC